jgi:hypothetical protein
MGRWQASHTLLGEQHGVDQVASHLHVNSFNENFVFWVQCVTSLPNPSLMSLIEITFG